MNKQDIIRQFGEAKYLAALESAKKSDFRFVDDLIEVNGEIVVTEHFELQLFKFIWEKKALTKLERLNLIFEFFEDFPFWLLVSAIQDTYLELDYTERECIYEWLEKQILRGGIYLERVEMALGDGLLDESYVSAELWSFLIREDTSPQVLKFVLPISGAIPYPLKKELYSRLIRDKTWHPYILESLVSSLVWYGGLNKEDAKKVYSQLDIPAGYERYQATFVEGIEAYQEVPPPPKPRPHHRKKKRPFD
jgi:hypothetical protein